MNVLEWSDDWEGSALMCGVGVVTWNEAGLPQVNNSHAWDLPGLTPRPKPPSTSTNSYLTL
jgi:hypothetical protein